VQLPGTVQLVQESTPQLTHSLFSFSKYPGIHLLHILKSRHSMQFDLQPVHFSTLVRLMKQPFGQVALQTSDRFCANAPHMIKLNTNSKMNVVFIF
jgi:hypothetical protein